MIHFRNSFIILLSFFALLGSSQDWERWYKEDSLDVVNNCIVEHYDHGIVILGHILDFDIGKSYPWIIKTNINGDTLWTKKMYSEGYLGMYRISFSNNGGILLAGNIYIDNDPELIVIKLNECGEKEWCTIIETDNSSCWAEAAFEMQNEEIAVLINQYSNPETLHVFKLNKFGELIWATPVCSINDYPDSRVPFGWDFLITSDNNILVSGHVYWKNPWDDLFPLRSFFSYINNDGIEEWVLPFGLNDSLLSYSLNSVERQNGNFIGLGAKWTLDKNNKGLYYNDFKHSNVGKLDFEFRNGLIMEFDKEGNEINYFIADFTDIDTSFKYQVFKDLFFVDSIAVIGGLFDDNTTFLNTGEITIDTSFFDTNFNVYHRVKHENSYDRFDYALTSDNKVLCSSTDRATFDDNCMYLTKLNRNLEQDSIYTAYYEYDYLCDQEIESGSIFIGDCDVIINVDEVPTPEQYRKNKIKVPLRVSPNPVLEEIKLSFENTENQQYLDLRITSVLGQQVYETTLIKGQTELSIPLSNWQKGVYLVQVYSNGKKVGSNRFVKM
jgi:hypothetical protein